MNAVLWFMALFGIAVASALFAGNNQASVTIFWHPYRVDLSMNLVLVGLAAAFLMLHLALRGVAGLFGIPRQARRWRLQQKERAIQGALLDGLSHLVSGRFIRARKSAEMVVALESSVTRSGEQLIYAERLRAIAHLLAAESAHALQDRRVRETHFVQALRHCASRDAHDTRDGVLLRAARWSLDERDSTAAMQWLDQLPQGAARRTVAMRLRLKTARLGGDAPLALETVRLLTKHRALSEVAGRSIARGLAMELLRGAHDESQLLRAWDSLDASERNMPDVAMDGAERLLSYSGSVSDARNWLLPVWETMLQHTDALTLQQRIRMVRILERTFVVQGDALDAPWLRRIEGGQLQNPRDPVLQYLAGVVCMRLSLWGKAQQMLKQSLSLLRDAELRSDAWRALAELAEQRQDVAAAAQAYREAAKR
jgi:HemY protein